MKRYLLLLICLLPLLSACRASEVPLDNPSVRIELTVVPHPPVVGESMFIIMIRDAEDEPINDASLEIRGDMTHAGMEPVLRSIEAGTDGRYSVMFEWTMSGDWFVDITATLPDGTQSRSRFNYRVGQ